MGGIFDFDPIAWAETLRVNLIGPALMVKHAGKAMVDQGRGGAIVLTASVAGLNSGAGPGAYSASKAGVINLAKTAAQQLSTRSEEHTSELQSLMRISYAVFCLKKKKIMNNRLQHAIECTTRDSTRITLHYEQLEI